MIKKEFNIYHAYNKHVCVYYSNNNKIYSRKLKQYIPRYKFNKLLEEENVLLLTYPNFVNVTDKYDVGVALKELTDE